MKQIQLQCVDNSITLEKYLLQLTPSSPIIKTLKTLIWFTIKLIYRYFLQLNCQGTQHLPPNNSYLIAANHTSHLDYAAIAIALEKHTDKIYALGAKDYFFTNKIKGWFFQTFFNVIPCNRNGDFLTSFRHCKQTLKQGNPVIIFPEGTRSTTGKIQPFQAGLGILALKANVPIVPVYIHGTYQALPKGKRCPRRYPIRITFGEPLNLSQYQTKLNNLPEKEIYQAITHEIQTSVMKLQNTLRDFA